MKKVIQILIEYGFSPKVINNEALEVMKIIRKEVSGHKKFGRGVHDLRYLPGALGVYSHFIVLNVGMLILK